MLTKEIKMKLKLFFATATALITSYSVKSEVDLLLTGGTVISPISKYQAEVKPNHWVAIRDNTIVEVGNGEQLPVANQQIDARGKFIIPGLMDSHTHLTSMPGLSFSDKNSKKMQAAFFERQGSNYLYYGVTQLIDPANTKVKVEILQSVGVSPDIFYCGAMPVLNGYNARGITQKELAKQRPYYVAQDKDPAVSQEFRREHSATRAVARMAKDGAQCAKVFIENGFNFANHIPIMDEANLKAVTKQAKKINLPVMAHANATDMQQIAIDAKIDILAHGLWNWLEEQSLSKEQAQPLPPKVKDIADQIIKHGIAYQPTINVMRSLRDLMVEGHLLEPEYRTVLPKWQLDWYLSEAGQWFTREMIKDWQGLPKPQMAQSLNMKLINGLRVVKYLYDGGVTILLGSDTPPAPTYASQPGLSTYWELENFAAAGIDLPAILAAATLNNAKAYNLSERYGSVEAGKVANILLLNSNPLKSVGAYNDIDTVVLQGRAIKRSDLHIDKLEQASP